MNTSKLKTSLIACVVGLMSLGPAGAALAQGRGNSDERRQEQRGQQGNDYRGDRNERGDRDGRRDRDDRHGHGHDRHGRNEGPSRWDNRDGRDHWNGRYSNRGRGAGPNHSYYVGNRLPPVYHQRQYVVDNWRAHQLRQPPRGYHWVQSGNDYLLVAVATGVILQLLLSN